MDNPHPQMEWVVYEGVDGRAQAITAGMFYHFQYGPGYQKGANVLGHYATAKEAFAASREHNEKIGAVK